MIDLHCHIIPGVDDGAEDLYTALAMARLAYDEGTRVIAATSHFNRPDQPPELMPQDLLAGLRRFKSELAATGCPLKLVQGMELFAGPNISSLLDGGDYLTINGTRYLLTEFFFDERSRFMDRCLREIEDHGLIPIVAHPERYEAIQRRPGILGEWFSRGYMIQLNKGSILGELGENAEDTAWWTLEHGFAHIVASDAHSEEERNPGMRMLSEVLGEELDPRYANLLLEENPRHLARGEEPAHSF